MHPHKSWWEIIQSYLYDVMVESTSSEYNPLLDVVLRKGKYQLQTRHAIYSYEDRYDNFGQVFNELNWQRFKPKKILVLGLGMGSVIQMLHHKHVEDAYYTAVEIDPTVVALAERYILSSLGANIQTYIADANIFIHQNKDEYDLILMDIFDDATIPAEMMTDEFLQCLSDALAPDGLLIYNTLASSELDQQKSRMFFDQTFKMQFPQGIIISTHENYMMLNRRINQVNR